MDEQIKSLKSLQSGESSSSQRHISQVTKVSRSKSKRVISKELLPCFSKQEQLGDSLCEDIFILLKLKLIFSRERFHSRPHF